MLLVRGTGTTRDRGGWVQHHLAVHDPGADGERGSAANRSDRASVRHDSGQARRRARSTGSLARCSAGDGSDGEAKLRGTPTIRVDIHGEAHATSAGAAADREVSGGASLGSAAISESNAASEQQQLIGHCRQQSDASAKGSGQWSPRSGRR